MRKTTNLPVSLWGRSRAEDREQGHSLPLILPALSHPQQGSAPQGSWASLSSQLSFSWLLWVLRCPSHHNLVPSRGQSQLQVHKRGISQTRSESRSHGFTTDSSWVPTFWSSSAFYKLSHWSFWCHSFGLLGCFLVSVLGRGRKNRRSLPPEEKVGLYSMRPLVCFLAPRLPK